MSFKIFTKVATSRIALVSSNPEGDVPFTNGVPAMHNLMEGAIILHETILRELQTRKKGPDVSVWTTCICI